MKDYLAINLSFDYYWKNILRDSLPDDADNIIHAIQRNYNAKNDTQGYDRSYAAIRKLVETATVADASEMEIIVKKFNQACAKKFRNKFLEGWYLLYS